jgi:hypothetical protein
LEARVAHVELSLSEAFVPHARAITEPEHGSSLALWTRSVTEAAEPCLLIDTEMAIVAVSEECCRLLRLGTPDTATGRSLIDGVLRLVDFTQARSELTEAEIEKIPPRLALKSGRLARGLLRIVAEAGDDDVVTVDAIATPLLDGGTVAGSLTFFCEV